MATTVPDSVSPIEGQQASTDHFAKCARRITSLLCGSVDVNGGRTVAEWERFLRSTDVSNVAGASNLQERISAIKEDFIHSQIRVLSNSATHEMETEESSAGTNFVHHNSQFSNDTNGIFTGTPNASEDTGNPEFVTCEPACNGGETTEDMTSLWNMSSLTAPCGIEEITLSASTRSAGQGYGISTLSSDISSRITTADSASSMHANTSFDGAVSVELNTCVNDCGSPLPIDDTSESISSLNTVSTDIPTPKRFMNWFRNPWHTQARADAASAMGDTTSFTSMGASDGSHEITNQHPFTILHSGHQAAKHQLYVAYVQRKPSCPIDDRAGIPRQEEGRSEDVQSAFGNLNEPDGSECFPGYGRGSPDGLSDEEVSSDTLSSEEIAIVDDSDMEAPDGLDGPQHDILSGNLEQPEDSRPASALSLVSEDSRSGRSWLTDTPEDDGEVPGILSPPPVTVLGMLPAGYHQSDDNLFGQRNSAPIAMDALRNSDLTAEECYWIQTHHPLPHPLPQDRDVPPGHRPYLLSSTNVIAALECPVCFNYMTTPIWLCVNGHNVCGHCQRHVHMCPVCRGRLLCTRNLALEAIAADVGFRSQKYNVQEHDSVIVLEEKIIHPTDISVGTMDAVSHVSNIDYSAASSLENEQEVASGHTEAVNGKPQTKLEQILTRSKFRILINNGNK